MDHFTLNPLCRIDLNDAARATVLLAGQTRTFEEPLLYRALSIIASSPVAIDLRSELRPHAPDAECAYVVLLLQKLGYIEVARPGGAAPLDMTHRLINGGVLPAFGSASIDLRTSPGKFRADLERLLGQYGVEISEDSSATILIVNDPFDPQVAAANAEAFRRGTSLVLATIGAGAITFGPRVVPHETACLTCLQHRLKAASVELKPRRDRIEPAPALDDLTIGHLALEIARIVFADEGKLEGMMRRIDILGSQITQHLIRRWAHCPACGRQAEPERPWKNHPVSWGQKGEVDFTPAASTLAGHIDPLAGAVKSLTRIVVSAAPEAFLFSSEVNSLQDGAAANNSLRLWAGGKGLSAEDARSSTLFEALERYSTIDEVGRSASVVAAADELGGTALLPQELYSFSEQQYAGRDSWNAAYGHVQPVPAPATGKTVTSWTELTSVLGRTTRLAPTSYCYYFSHDRQTPAICFADSNGVAAGTTLAEAILRGTLELVERDAVSLWWYNQIPRAHLSVADNLGPAFGALMERYAALGLTVSLLDITSDIGIPVVAAMCFSRKQFPARLAFGFGCHLDQRSAARSAMLELMQKLPVLLDPALRGDPLHLLWCQIRTLGSEHLSFLCPDRVSGSSPEEISSVDVSTETALDIVCRAVLERGGIEPLFLDLTKEDVGLPTARVIAPGLRHFWRRTGPGRLFDVPVKAGWLSTQRHESELNPVTLLM